MPANEYPFLGVVSAVLKAEHVLFVLIGLALYITTNCPWHSAAGTSFAIIQIIIFIRECNRRIPIDRLFVVLAGLQWIIGPFIAYSGYNEHYKYFMYVRESEYMELAVPGVLLFWLGFLIFRRKNNDIITEKSLKTIRTWGPKPGYYLIAAGIIMSLISPFMPGSLQFVFYLLSNMKYVGILYLVYGESKNKWLVILIAFILTFLSSVQAAMFHNLILWTILLGIFLLYYLKLNLLQKTGIFVAGLLVVFSIQAVKHQFREMVWAGAVSGNETAYFQSLVTDEIQSGLFSRQNIEDMVYRVNQGWIISRVMYYTPTFTSFADGETVKDALEATLLPRFIAPDKKIAGGKENYERFTGYILHTASMGISLLGEGYANFGITGAWLFMFGCGMFFSLMLHLIIGAAKTRPSLILWLPLLFLQAVKAETELIVVMNYLVKATILVFLLFWGVRKFLGWKL